MKLIIFCLVSIAYVSCKDSVPDAIDWREKGVITQVKDQSDCDGSFYFAALGILESYYYQKTGERLDLSEQSAIDCSLGYNNGCNGGAVLNTLAFVRNKGVVLEESYPYKASLGDCQMEGTQSILKTVGYEMLPQNEEELKAAVGTTGPVAVTFNAQNLTSYSGGIYKDPTCGSTTHSGIVVGYGTSTDSVDYWIIKMSFGTNWGEDGYVKIARDVAYECGIANKAIYPIL
ncbi:hypothetical protein NQ315_010490 [Exocentrus adspersus]|uniref:Peptidase C1A papain C-terminal domain-containing protein n=1 Tax=Exocentrus adspersus TaxID=1586481 RepID=A0AAV8W5I3_9CUCU|nr:hypothetical protein NQ315_010490 [Exocentrus adspersus]